MLMSVWTILEQRANIVRQGTADWSLGMTERFIVAGKAIWFYAGKVLWPANLAFVYPRWKLTADSLGSWLPAAGIVAGVVVLWAWRRQSWARAAQFGLGFFVMALLPVLGFFDVFYFQYSYVADHFQYLASLGIVTLSVTAIERIATGRLTALRTAIFAALLVTLAGLTWRREHVYRDVESVWQDTLAKNPDCWMAHYNLGTGLGQSGKYQEAIDQFEQTLRIKPDCADAHINLGIASYKTGKPAEAITHLKQALLINPNSAKAH